jgi:prolyl oligopeptidase
MKRAWLRLLPLLLMSLTMTARTAPPSPSPSAEVTAPQDPHAWLEAVDSDAALDWVRAQNARSLALLQAQPDFEPTRRRLLSILDSTDRIPEVTRRGAWLYNLWQDASHPRGLWRRTTLADYRRARPSWETVLDLDALAAKEGENWVWAGANCLGPDYRRCLVSLSRGGADAHVVREFDTVEKAFVAGGFWLPEAKSDVTWIDADHVYVGTDFGPGSMTDSGYPRVIKRWARATPLADAVQVFEGLRSDVSVSVTVDRTPGFERVVFARSTDFYNEQRFLASANGLVPFALPSDASWRLWHSVGGTADTLLVELRSDWSPAQGSTRFVRGSLLAADARAFLAGEPAFTALFEPTPTRSLAGWTTTRDHLLVNVLDDVASRLEEWRRSAAESPGTVHFARREVSAPFPGTLSTTALHDPLLRNDALADAYLLVYTDFLTPDTLMLGHAGRDAREPLKARPALFNAAGLRAEQHFARSADGTRVPYFLIRSDRVDGAPPAQATPTLLYGYGGFEVSMQPWYSAAFGSAWFERGGALAIANIRGGGEYGPGWHQAAVKAGKQRSYDDFLAVAEDLVARQVTSPRHLGIQGGSNGGLLVGAAVTQRPDLFNAVVCQVPLLDMRRYHRLLAGASWMAEYGDPDDPAQWAFISRYSPYHNVKTGVRYPRILFTTSTRDDRVHPAHARKMAARLLELGNEVLYYENIEGGHGGAADNAQRALLQALEFTYLWLQLARP